MRSWILVALVAIAVPAVAGDDEADATRELQEAQRLLRKAEAHRAAGRFERAADAFGAAADIVRRRSPDSLALADALNGRGATLLDVNRYADAVPAFEEALALRKRVGAGDSEESTALLHNLAFAYLELGRVRDAVAPAEEALAMALRRLPPEHPDVLSNRSTLVQVYLEAGRFREALPLAEKTLADRKRILGPDHDSVGVSMTMVIALYRQLGRYADGIPVAREALDLARRLHPGDHRDVVTDLDNLGLLLLEVGRHEEALALRREAVAMVRRLPPDDRALALALGNLAYTLATTGRPLEALPLMEEALALARRGYPPGHPQVAITLDNLAGMYLQVGRPVDALPLLEEALPLWRRIHAEGHPDVAICMDNLGTVYEDLGRPADALRVMEQSLALWERLFPAGDHAEVAVCLSNLGATYAASQQLDRAVETQTRAVAMWQRIFPGDHPQIASATTGLATTLRMAGRSAEALPLQEKALAMWRALFKGDHSGISSALHNLAGIHIALGRVPEAVTALEEAVQISERLATGDASQLWTSLGHALAKTGRPAEAAAAYEKAMRGVDVLRSRARSLGAAQRLAYSARVRLDDPYTAMVGLLARMDKPVEAVETLERGRARELLDLLERSAVDPLERAEEAARSSGDAALTKRIEESRSEVAHAESLVLERERAERDLARSAADRAAALEARRASAKARRELLDAMDRQSHLVRDVVPEGTASAVPSIQALLGPDERMLLYSLGPEASQLFVLGPAPLPVRVFALQSGDQPLGAAQVEEAVRAYAETLSDESRAPVAASAGEELFHRLVPDAAWAEVRGARRVVVVPHGALHALPFETLVVARRDGAPTYWLDEGPAVAYASSGSVLRGLRARRDAQRSVDAPLSLLAVGDPVFAVSDAAVVAQDAIALARTSRSRSRTLEPLPGTRAEVEDVRGVFVAAGAPSGKVTVLLGADATERRVHDGAAGARFLHLATHGIVDETGTASFSALALSSPSPPAPGDDGFLTLVDLLTRWRARLVATELVVLSACETQRGPVQRENGIFALPWGFHFAGCPTVVATLWPVADATTPELMGDFYRRVLAAKGEGKLEALTAAKKALRAKHPHPHDWGPFVLLGDPR